MKNSDSRTPLFPRPPSRAARAMIRAVSPTDAGDDARAPSTTSKSVMYMFVPVSPSGTGNTLSRLTSGTFA